MLRPGFVLPSVLVIALLCQSGTFAQQVQMASAPPSAPATVQPLGVAASQVTTAAGNSIAPAAVGQTAQYQVDQGPASGMSSEEAQRLANRLDAAESEIRALRQRLQTSPTAFQQPTTSMQEQGNLERGTLLPGGPSTPMQEQGNIEGRFSTILGRLTNVEGALQKAGQVTYPTFVISGFTQLDTGAISQSVNSKAIYGNMQNATDFRRARLLAAGNLTEQTKYWFEVDFAAAGRPSFMDVWGEQSDLPFFGNIRVGQFRQPITLNGALNVRHLEFLEYSSVFSAFDPFRRVGAGSWFVTEDQRSFINYSVYGTGATFYNGTNPSNGTTVYNSLGNDNRFGTTLSDKAVSFAIRGTRLLYWDEPTNGRYFFHVGAGYNFSQIGGSGTTGPDARTYEARTFPEFFVGDPTAAGTTAGGTPNTLDTGRFLANNFSIYHLESCGSYGPAHFQAEYVATVVSQMNGPLVFLDGAYLQVGYFLTGENVGYNKYMGAIDYNVKPFTNFFGLGRNKGLIGWGAWELATRLSYLDLNGNVLASNQVALPPTTAGAGPNQAGNPNPFLVIPGGGGINQGQMVNYTIGINWWWNPYTRVQLNYIYSMVHSSNGGSGGTTVAGADPAVNYGFNATSYVGGRFQIEF